MVTRGDAQQVVLPFRHPPMIKVKTRRKGVGCMSDKLKMARQFIQALPHSMALGMELQELGDGSAVITMPYDDKLVGDPATATDEDAENLVATATGTFTVEGHK